ncbi:MAG: MSHA biogenesis protein MshE [Gammaproteobacteria bacterium SG8_11]|nr:MAG: MSHA biogenesis protein MshE [Gammaproteobacteria bacterium SG8_11]
MAQRIRLGDLLVEHKLISEGQLQAALEEQKKSGRKLGRVLIENGYVKEDVLLNLLSSQLNLPFVDLGAYQFQPEISKLIPETLARRYRVLALEEQGNKLLVGMADPTNIFAYDEVVKVLKRPVSLAVVKESDLLQGIDKVYQREDEIKSLASELGEELAENVFDLSTLNQSAAQSDAPVVKLIETVFEDAVKANASDIHIEPDEDVLRIRRRIDGVLHEQVMDEKRIAAAVVSRLKLMAGLDISERRLPQDGRFNLKLKNKAVDVRLSTMPIVYGEAVVMRLLDHSGAILRLDRIGMEPELEERVRKAIFKPHGLMLVTGPTGSGKTTTLYAALNELNKPERKIITVEDPVEYQLPRINQVQVNAKVGLDFARVLRTTLRQDPDVILVGEIRDKETAEIALRASITGHLVLSTLHTNDAVSTATRLIDMGLESYMVATAVHAILSQRLVRKICEKCATDHDPDSGEQVWLNNVLDEKAQYIRLKRGAGCAACNYTGYRGRVAVHELLELNDALADALRRKDYVEFKNVALAQADYQPLVYSALKLAERGETTLAEVIRISGWID